MNLLSSQLGRLRLLAFLEGVSFLLILGVTMPLKYVWAMPAPNKYVGYAHGALFALYCLAVIQITIEENWKAKKVALSLVASIIPFGTFWADRKLFKEEKPEEADW